MPEAQEAKVPRIVAGVDGSPTSVAALRWAVGQARLAGAAVDAVIAWHFPVGYGGFGYGTVPLIDNADFAGLAAKTLREAVEAAGVADTGVSVREHVVEGNPARVLLDAAAGADLLVVGSRGYGGFTEMLLGSVGQHCVHHASCPVVVIRGDQQD